jgi:single-strand DNA-binding protein
MSLEIEGILRVKFDTQKVKESFQKREFVIETAENYPQKVKFEITQDKCSLLDAYKEGDKIKVSFNLRGSEWQGKYYVNLQAWKLERTEGSTNSGGSSGSNQGGSFPPPMEPKIDDSFDDGLPF